MGPPGPAADRPGGRRPADQDRPPAHHERAPQVQTVARPDGRVVQALLDLSDDRAERSGLVAAFTTTGLDGPVSAEVDGLIADAGRLTEILDDPAVGRRSPTARRGRCRPAARTDGRGGRVGPAGGRRAGRHRHGRDRRAPPPVIGAPAGLRRAVSALLDNASRHAAGEVRVIVGTEGRDVLVDVVVDGPGIFPHILAAMFDQVTRCPGGDRSADRHYGLDLALVNEVAAAPRRLALDRPHRPAGCDPPAPATGCPNPRLNRPC